MSNEPWSILRKDWDAISGELIEGSWFNVSFNLPSQDLVKPLRGVYVVTMRVPRATTDNFFNEIHNPIYVGISTNLRSRFKQHTSGRSPNALWRKLSEVRNFCTFNYCCFPGCSKVDLRKMEQQLINCFGKQLNEINSVAQRAPISAVYSNGGEDA